MDELANINWFLVQAKRQFQVFDIANQETADNKPEPSKKYITSKYANGRRKRPRESLAVLIYQALRYHKRRLTVAEIADYISEKYVYYKLRKHWTITGTIRNALSKDDRFHKIGRTQKENKRGCFWILSCAPLWDQIVNGVAPSINNESDFRTELQKLSTYEYQSEMIAPNSTNSTESNEITYTPPVEENNWFDSDNFDCIEFEDFDLLVREIDQHPWEEDKLENDQQNEWYNGWMF